MQSQQAVAEGLLGNLLQGMQAGGLKTKPEMRSNTLVITITEAEMTDLATRGITPQAKNNIQVKVLEGKIEITVKLW